MVVLPLRAATSRPCLGARSCHRSAATRRVAAAAPPLDAVCFTLILDDIVHPDGTTTMAALGGGGPQSLFGLRLHRADLSVGLAASVGAEEYPSAWLASNHVDVSGLLRVEESGPGGSTTLREEAGAGAFQTPRAWQVCEHDGRRTQVWRTAKPEPARLRPRLALLPPPFRSARLFHVGVHPQLAYDRAHSAELRGSAQLLSVEPYTTSSEPLSPAALRELVSVPDIWSPNAAEAASILGRSDLSPLEMARRFVEAGARVVCIRCGADGAVCVTGGVAEWRSGGVTGAEAWSVPAYEGAQPVDATGCGNAFCGAFLASWAAGEGLLEAACWGCAAASFMLECRAVPDTPAHLLRNEAEQRVSMLRKQAVSLTL